MQYIAALHCCFGEDVQYICVWEDGLRLNYATGKLKAFTATILGRLYKIKWPPLALVTIIVVPWHYSLW